MSTQSTQPTRATTAVRLLAIFGSTVVGLGCTMLPESEPQRFEFSQIAMGVEFRLAFYAAEAAQAQAAALAAYARIRELDRSLSDYRADSEVNRLCDRAGDHKFHKVSSELFTVLEQSNRLAENTGGAFDVTVGPLSRLWRRAGRFGHLPPKDELERARRVTDWKQVDLDADTRSVRLRVAGMRLDFGGIAKGYALDEAMKVLVRHGIDSALIDGGGDILVSAPPPDAAGWRIGIAPLDSNAEPSRFLVLSNAAVATSGDAFQHVVIGGVRYSHIVDPHTGLGLTDQYSVTVIARNGINADSLATAASVLGWNAALKVVEEHDAAALVVRSDGKRTRTLESPSFAAFSTVQATRRTAATNE